MVKAIALIIGVAVGLLITIKSEWFLNAFGRVPFAEKYLGFEGGSRLFYKLLGVAIILLSILLFTGILENMILKFLGSLFGMGR